MAGYSLKLFKRKDRSNTNPKSKGVQSIDRIKVSQETTVLSSHGCGTKTTFGNSISAKSPTAVTQAEYIFDAVLDNRSEPASSTDKDIPDYSEHMNSGVYITPIPRRLSEFSPPRSMFDGVPEQAIQRNGRSKSIRKLLPWKRVSSSRSVVTTSQSSNEVRAPYLSKTALSKLSPALKNSSVAQGSAWHRPVKFYPGQYEIGSHASKPPSVIDIKIVPSSSDSCVLPPVISPAYKFLPIGHDNDDDCTFSSADYEICDTSSSDVESNDMYASERYGLLESKSFVEPVHRATVTYETRHIRSEPMSTRRSVNGSSIGANKKDDMTPFEMDLRAASQESNGADSCPPTKADQTLSPAESLSTFDVSNEFSLVTLHVIESAQSQSIDNNVAIKENVGTHRGGWFVWDQFTSVMSCSAS